jgi:hypothetical protein
MNRSTSLLFVAVASLCLLACPKANPGPDLGDSDDAKMDSIAAKLEEYKTAANTDCAETCATKTKICSLSETACEIAGRSADRAEYQKRCVATQEECARFNESCSTCKK